MTLQSDTPYRGARASTLKTGLRCLACAVAACLAFGASPFAVTASADASPSQAASTEVLETDIDRIAGRTRFGTAVSVSKRTHPSGSDSVVIATGRNWPDALGGAALAAALDAPVLLVEPATAPSGVVNELVRLDPDRVVLLGGVGAVSDSVADQLRSELPSATVVRAGAENRYMTAAQVASMTIDAVGAGWDGHAFVATGRGFADALAVGPLCAGMDDPLYLIGESAFADTVILEMLVHGVTDVTVVGGAGAVSDQVAYSLSQALGGWEHVERVGGSDRFGTSALLAEFAVDKAGFSWSDPGVATGLHYADAIAAGPMLGAAGSPLLLAGGSSVSPGIAGHLYDRREAVTGFTVFGGEGAVPPHVVQEFQHAILASAFDTGRAMDHIAHLAGLGPRGAGSVAERLAFAYIEVQLESYGYTATRQPVSIPSGLGSYNIIAEKTGSSSDVIVLGAHVDSKPPSPGGNDNASGVGVTLELARILADAPTQPTVRFIAFGAEEISGATPDDHHFGSRQYVDSLSAAELAKIHGAVSIDMVGYGETFNIRHMGLGTFSLIWSLQERGGFVGQPIPYLRDPGRYGWSDHEAFEFAGVPAAWLEWRDDPDYHTVRDTAAHVQPSRVRSTGRVVRGWILEMDEDGLAALR